MKRFLGSVAFLWLCFGATTHAQEVGSRQYPASFTARPLTLPQMTLRGDLGFQVIHVDFGFAEDTATVLGAGAGASTSA